MISVTPWLFYLYMLNIRNVIGVRIFQNLLPEAMPAKYVKFVPQVLSNTCLLKPEQGPCRAGITMFYYEPEIAKCKAFKWGGCQGNGNRFNSQKECRHKCLSKQGGSKPRPKWCALTFDYGFCFGAVKRYYFDNLWKVCKTTIYSGCGGNRNNFYSHEQCESVCLYGNGPIDAAPKAVTALSKVLIINPIRSQMAGRSDSIPLNNERTGNGQNGGNGNGGNGYVGNTNRNGNGHNGGNGKGRNDNDNGIRNGLRLDDGKHKVDNSDDDDDNDANKDDKENDTDNSEDNNSKNVDANNDVERNGNNDTQGNNNNNGNDHGKVPSSSKQVFSIFKYNM